MHLRYNILTKEISDFLYDSLYESSLTPRKFFNVTNFIRPLTTMYTVTEGERIYWSIWRHLKLVHLPAGQEVNWNFGSNEPVVSSCS